MYYFRQTNLAPVQDISYSDAVACSNVKKVFPWLRISQSIQEGKQGHPYHMDITWILGTVYADLEYLQLSTLANFNTIPILANPKLGLQSKHFKLLRHSKL